jgi:hypothetical protein
LVDGYGSDAFRYYTTLEAASRATWLLDPIIPRAAARVRNDLGVGKGTAPIDVDGVTWNRLVPGAVINLGTPHFPKLRVADGG